MADTWLDVEEVTTALGSSLADVIDDETLQFWCDAVRSYVEERRRDLFVTTVVELDLTDPNTVGGPGGGVWDATIGGVIAEDDSEGSVTAFRTLFDPAQVYTLDVGWRRVDDDSTGQAFGGYSYPEPFAGTGLWLELWDAYTENRLPLLDEGVVTVTVGTGVTAVWDAMHTAGEPNLLIEVPAGVALTSFAMQVGPDAESYVPTPAVVGGASLLAYRLYQRRTAPLGTVASSEQIGTILRDDPDVARMLGIGRHRRFRFGAPRPVDAGV